MRTALLVLVFAACGDGDRPGPDAGGDILVQLQALPGVTVAEQPSSHAPAGYRYFVLRVTQPVDHTAPGGPTFEQEVSLLHVDRGAPMIAVTSGYEDFVLDRAAEPTRLLHANQISIEHRYFGASRPAPTDWSKLTIAQMAADEHAIVTLLKPIYGGAWVSSGGSKGGMTAVYHRRFYPEDVAGTVAYVAPESFAIPDQRYAGFLDQIGTQACRDAIRAVATEMLASRRPALLQRAQADATANGHTYTRIAIGPALESAIQDFEWTFWQYHGVAGCVLVPATTASDDEIWNTLERISPVEFSDDATTAMYEAYFYQAYAQLGSPGAATVRGDTPPAYLAPFVQFSDADFAGTLPLGVPVPAFDPSAMRDIDDWLERSGSHLLLVYGEWDPWTGGKFALGGAVDARAFVQAHGTHGASLVGLDTADRDAALARLAAWTGVTPTVPSSVAGPLDDPMALRHGPAR
jgi:hypothetical protein